MELPYTERYVRWCERSEARRLLLLDCFQDRYSLKCYNFLINKSAHEEHEPYCKSFLQEGNAMIQNFMEQQKQIFSLFQAGDLDKVHTAIEQAEKDFPERLDKILFWKACVYAIQERSKEAVDVLQDGLNEGIWWNPATLTQDRDLSGLQGREDFQEVIRQCKSLLHSQKENTRPELYTYGNPQADIGIFTLHWRGANAPDFAAFWLDQKREQDYAFGFPQSSQIFASRSYCWDDKGKAEEDLKSAYQDWKNKHAAKQEILAGASQGGKLAIELLLAREELPASGFIAVIPAIQDVTLMEELLKKNKHAGLRGCVITGDQDPFYSKTVELAGLFEEYGLSCRLIVKEGLGHFFPDDFPELLSEAVSFVLEK